MSTVLIIQYHFVPWRKPIYMEIKSERDNSCVLNRKTEYDGTRQKNRI